MSSNKKQLTIHSVHILEFPNEDGNEYNDEGTIAEVGLLAYLESHSEWIKSVQFSIGSAIVEEKHEVDIDV